MSKSKDEKKIESKSKFENERFESKYESDRDDHDERDNDMDDHDERDNDMDDHASAPVAVTPATPVNTTPATPVNTTPTTTTATTTTDTTAVITASPVSTGTAPANATTVNPPAITVPVARGDDSFKRHDDNHAEREEDDDQDELDHHDDDHHGAVAVVPPAGPSTNAPIANNPVVVTPVNTAPDLAAKPSTTIPSTTNNAPSTTPTVTVVATPIVNNQTGTVSTTTPTTNTVALPAVDPATATATPTTAALPATTTAIAPTGRYSFAVSNGTVASVNELKKGFLASEKIDANETYQVQADGSIVKQEVERNGVEFTVYKDLDGDGYFDKVDHGWIAKKDLAPTPSTTPATTPVDTTGTNAVATTVLAPVTPAVPASSSAPATTGTIPVTTTAALSLETPKVHKDWYELSGRSSDYKLAVDQGVVQVQGASTPTTETLGAAKRVLFEDKALAFGHEAETVAKLLGAVFGQQAVANKDYAAIGLSMLDNGVSQKDLAELAAKAAGLQDHHDIVEKLWENLFHHTGSDEELSPYVGMLDQGTSVGDLVLMAANTTLNTQNIGLVGIQQTGLEFNAQPVI